MKDLKKEIRKLKINLTKAKNDYRRQKFKMLAWTKWLNRAAFVMTSGATSLIAKTSAFITYLNAEERKKTEKKFGLKLLMTLA